MGQSCALDFESLKSHIEELMLTQKSEIPFGAQCQ